MSELLIGILSAYLAFTTTLATQINTWLDPETALETAGTTESLDSLPTAYEFGGVIPDILLRNAFYQQASVAGASIPKNQSASLADATVNIYCEYKTDTYIRSTTGSGFIIAETGVVLTNAHVAQFLLLEGVSDTAETDCVVRMGSPAVPTYEAELLYISPAWIIENAKLISDAAPRGTGERDYALLYITRRTSPEPVPGSIPALPFDTTPLTPTNYGDDIKVAGYPSTTIDPTDVALTPEQRIATSSVFFLYTFGNNTSDLISLTGTPVGASGVSGGPVVNRDGAAVGLIVTKGDDTTQGAGSLNAITLSYINRTITDETGFTLAEVISGDLPRKAKIFKDTMVPILRTMLTNELAPETAN